MKRGAVPSGERIRCAIYTRKSTEEGLEQEFNSLDAQYEACAAYIASQKHEGWVQVKDRYDDGGISGGTMERPGLQRLLDDIRNRLVDVIVVYKVDRLTRSLADFAKIVEILDDRKASFVSVTQAFNTTTSMGRLTLNVLLSFAQFEREVTGERIRDKIAASKRKGLWMGGPVPLGYEVKERKLIVNETEAELVRHIYQRYITLRSVRELVEELNRDGHVTKVQHRTSGPHRGGVPFRRGTLYHLLSNRIYLGEIVHKGEAHAGEHPAIIPTPLWTEVQDKLAARSPGALGQRTSERCSHLIGLLFDGLGRPMTSSHSSTGSRRYRYYRTRQATRTEPAWSVSAHDVERLVQRQLGDLLTDRDRMARLIAGHDPRQMDHGVAAARKLATGEPLLPSLALLGVQQIDLGENHLEIMLSERDLLRACGMVISQDHDGVVRLSTPVRKVRRGHDIRLVIPGEETANLPAARPDSRLVSLIHEAMETRKQLLARPDQSISAFAASQGKCRKRTARLLHLSWLAPDIIRAIVDGTQPASLTSRVLMTVELPVGWDRQKAAFGFG